jgi:hypothetical protein
MERSGGQCLRACLAFGFCTQMGLVLRRRQRITRAHLLFKLFDRAFAISRSCAGAFKSSIPSLYAMFESYATKVRVAGMDLLS